MKKLSLAAIAGVFALSMMVSAPVGARPGAGPSAPAQIDQGIDLVKKAKKKKAKKSKAGKCGTYKYYSKKAKKCVDARDKK